MLFFMFGLIYIVGLCSHFAKQSSTVSTKSLADLPWYGVVILAGNITFVTFTQPKYANFFLIGTPYLVSGGLLQSS